jgi:hypothetical protein
MASIRFAQESDLSTMDESDRHCQKYSVEFHSIQAMNVKLPQAQCESITRFHSSSRNFLRAYSASHFMIVLKDSQFFQ